MNIPLYIFAESEEAAAHVKMNGGSIDGNFALLAYANEENSDNLSWKFNHTRVNAPVYTADMSREVYTYKAADLSNCKVSADVSLSYLTDVMPDDWYYSALRYCIEEGIYTLDDGQTTFDACGDALDANGNTITREEFIVYLYEKSKAAGMVDENQLEIVNLKCSDRDKITPENINAVKWAYMSGIVTGKVGLRFDPQANITNAEIATFYYRYGVRF